MRVKTGRCRMPIGACSEFRNKDCGKFCYYNTVEVKTHFDQIREMSVEEMAETFANQCLGRVCHHGDSCKECWLEWLKEAI